MSKAIMISIWMSAVLCNALADLTDVTVLGDGSVEFASLRDKTTIYSSGSGGKGGRSRGKRRAKAAGVSSGIVDEHGRSSGVISEHGYPPEVDFPHFPFFLKRTRWRCRTCVSKLKKPWCYENRSTCIDDLARLCGQSRQHYSWECRVLINLKRDFEEWREWQEELKWRYGLPQFPVQIEESPFECPHCRNYTEFRLPEFARFLRMKKWSCHRCPDGDCGDLSQDDAVSPKKKEGRGCYVDTFDHCMRFFKSECGNGNCEMCDIWDDFKTQFEEWTRTQRLFQDFLEEKCEECSSTSFTAPDHVCTYQPCDIFQRFQKCENDTTKCEKDDHACRVNSQGVDCAKANIQCLKKTQCEKQRGLEDLKTPYYQWQADNTKRRIDHEHR